MAEDAENRWKKMDATTMVVEIGIGTHLTIPAGLAASAKSAALSGFPQWQAWLAANLPAGTAKTWHLETAPEIYKQGIWLGARI